MKNVRNEEYVICPRCKQEVYKEAIICPFCKFGTYANIMRHQDLHISQAA